MAGGRDPMGLVVPIPRGLMELVGDFNRSLKDAEKELIKINQELGKTKVAADPGRMEELQGRRERLLEHVLDLRRKEETAKLVDEKIRAAEALARRGMGYAGTAQRVLAGRITARDFDALGMVLKAHPMMKAIGAAMGVGAIVGGAVYYAMDRMTEHYRNVSKANENQSKLEAAVYRGIHAKEIYGTQWAGEDLQAFQKSLGRAGEQMGSAAAMLRAGELMSYLWVGLGMQSAEAMTRGTEAQQRQYKIEMFARMHGEQWRKRLDPMELAKSPDIQRQIAREEAYMTGGTIGFMTGVFRDWITTEQTALLGLRIIHERMIDPRKQRAIELGQQRADKLMEDEEKAWQLMDDRRRQAPEYAISSQYRNVWLRAWERYQHERYLQWNPM